MRQSFPDPVRSRGIYTTSRTKRYRILSVTRIQNPREDESPYLVENQSGILFAAEGDEVLKILTPIIKRPFS